MTLPSYRVSLGVSTEKVQFSGVSGGKLSGSCCPLCSFTIEGVEGSGHCFLDLPRRRLSRSPSEWIFFPPRHCTLPITGRGSEGSEQAGKGDPFASNQPLIFHQVSAPRGGTFRKRPRSGREAGRQTVLEILRRCFSWDPG